jgi:hypothetical protein
MAIEKNTKPRRVINLRGRAIKGKSAIKCKSVVGVLCDDFSLHGGDASQKSDMEFFESVFMHLPDAIIYADITMQIKQANFACARLFEEDVEGCNLRMFLTSGKFRGNVDALFDLSAGTTTQTLVFRRHDEEDTRMADTGRSSSHRVVM